MLPGVARFKGGSGRTSWARRACWRCSNEPSASSNANAASRQKVPSQFYIKSSHHRSHLFTGCCSLQQPPIRSSHSARRACWQPTLPFSTLPFPTLPYPTLPYPTLPYPTLPCVAAATRSPPPAARMPPHIKRSPKRENLNSNPSIEGSYPHSPLFKRSSSKGLTGIATVATCQTAINMVSLECYLEVASPFVSAHAIVHSSATFYLKVLLCTASPLSLYD